MLKQVLGLMVLVIGLGVTPALAASGHYAPTLTCTGDGEHYVDVTVTFTDGRTVELSNGCFGNASAIKYKKTPYVASQPWPADATINFGKVKTMRVELTSASVNWLYHNDCVITSQNEIIEGRCQATPRALGDVFFRLVFPVIP